VALRWHTVVVDCDDARAQAAWWSEVLNWRVIHETDNECVIVPPWVDDTTMREMPRERIGPGMVFVRVADAKIVKNRLHLDLAPQADADRDAEIARLERLGATRTEVGQPANVSWTVFADPEGNEFCVLSSETP
jgi:catechol 2,3-dioxygenase-like lactoylglutathione lyase family enzyme